MRVISGKPRDVGVSRWGVQCLQGVQQYINIGELYSKLYINSDLDKAGSEKGSRCQDITVGWVDFRIYM